MELSEAQTLIKKFIKLREKASLTKDGQDVAKFKTHEKLCIEKFKYIVLMRAARYKQFSNYDDLIQEGLLALVKAMKTYNPQKGNWFFWAHKYIDTRIARCANLHTTIRFPLKFTKLITPKREIMMPIIADPSVRPDAVYETEELQSILQSTISKLSSNQKKVVRLIFGMDGEVPHSVNKVCKKLRISRPTCLKILDQAFETIKSDVRIY